tara:strand:- start:17032 stop:17376 length:345 start_codon:yes stop_codon:yes gene_type:complete
MSDIFKENIKQWVTLDNELRILNEHVKELRDKRNSINEDIIRYVETNQLNASTIQLSDGSLKFAKQKIYAPLTYTFLLEVLKQILPESQVTTIIDYIKQKRITTPSTVIKRSLE